MINRKIERVQPRVNQIFGKINQPRNELKIDRFFDYLLNNSRLIGKKIIFPNGLQPPLISINNPKLRYIKVDKKFAKASPKTREPQNINHEKQESTRKVWDDKWKLHLKVKDLCKEFEERLIKSSQQQLLFSPIFFDIINGEWENFELATKFSYAIISKFANNEDWEMQIIKEYRTDARIKNIKTWEILIQKKYSNS